MSATRLPLKFVKGDGNLNVPKKIAVVEFVELTKLRQSIRWGFDCLCWPGVGHLTDLVLAGEGIFESFFARRGDI